MRSQWRSVHNIVFRVIDCLRPRVSLLSPPAEIRSDIQHLVNRLIDGDVEVLTERVPGNFGRYADGRS